MYRTQIAIAYSRWQYRFYLVALGGYLFVQFISILFTWNGQEVDITIDSRFAAASGMLLAVNLISAYGLIWSIILIYLAYVYVFGFTNIIEFAFISLLLFLALAAWLPTVWQRQKEDWRMSPWLIYPVQLLFLCSLAIWWLDENYWQLAWMQLLFLLFVFDPRFIPPYKVNAEVAPIIFFDGVCVFCNQWVDFLLKEDFSHIFRFAPLQGKTARALLPKQTVDEPTSIVFYKNDRAEFSAKACLQIGYHLGGIWRLAATLLNIIIPNFILEGLYRWVAKRRYNWFGRLQECRIPSAKERLYFLD